MLMFWCVLLGLCLAPISSHNEHEQELFVPIVKSVAKQKNDGSYFFAYEGGDGNYREEVGIVKQSTAAEDEDDELEVSGVYRYVDTNGALVEVSYVADKNGYRAQSKHLVKQKK